MKIPLPLPVPPQFFSIKLKPGMDPQVAQNRAAINLFKGLKHCGIARPWVSIRTNVANQLLISWRAL